MPEIDPFASSDDVCSLVVTGGMNPAIHHPRWYLAIGVLSEQEALEAESHAPLAPDGRTPEASSVVCTGFMSQFTAGSIRVMCVQANWSVVTTDPASLRKMRDICDAVFKALPHTPVSGFAFNFAFHRATELEDVGTQLAGLAQRLPFGFRLEADAKASASFQYNLSRGNRELNISVEPSVRDPKKIYVGINAAHRIEEEGFFDLGPLLDSALDQDSGEAQEWLSKMTAAMRAREA